MYDIKWIREQPSLFDAGLATRGMAPLSHELIALDQRNRELLTTLQEMQNRRNTIAKDIGMIKKSGGDASALMDEATMLRDKLPTLEAEQEQIKTALHDILSATPNLPLGEVPVGLDETGNQLVHVHGTIPTFSFTPKEHFELGEALGMMNFEQAAKISGARFVVLKKELAQMERALISFMLNLHTQEFGYEETIAPYLVKDAAAYGVGHLPKARDDMFQTTNGYWLISTAEASLTNLVSGDILDEAELPKRFTGFSPCFRSEAGSAGRDTRGMLRQHQFHKVELVSITHPDQSESEHQRMLGAAEEVLKRLELPYRVMLLCTGDMGFSSRKTYDLEVWMPGQNTYREISSCSQCGEFQARRMNARFREKETQKTRFVHTLNGSGLAVGRTLIAILENYQQSDGSIRIPDALQPYMNGKTVIAAR